MEILTTQLPSGGYKYPFTTVSISPMNFLQITKYLENCPQDPLEKYLYDIRLLKEEDPNIQNCYVMDLDFLIFLKKLITVSDDLTYTISVKCPDCGRVLKKRISLESDIHFKQIDSKIMEGAQIRLGNTSYDTIVPTVKDLEEVMSVYIRYKKITDIKIIKTISLIKNFKISANQIEKDILEAKHSDITLLLALQELYFDRLEGIELTCPCSKDKEGRRGMTVSVESLIVDFFRDILNNCPIDESKILFK